MSELNNNIHNSIQEQNTQEENNMTNLSRKEMNQAALKEKIGQKVMHIVKGNAFATIYRIGYKDGRVHYQFEPDTSDLVLTTTTMQLAVISDDIKSEYFSQYSVSTGMLDAHLNKEHVQAARIESNDGRSEVAYINKEMLVDRESIAVEADGASATEVYVVDKNDLGLIGDSMHLDQKTREKNSYSGRFEDVIGKAEVWKVGARSASQTRQGSLVLIPENKTYVEHMTELKFFIDSYAKPVSATETTVSTSIQSRLKMAASSGKLLDLFGDLEFVSVEDHKFSGFGSDVIVGKNYKFANADGEIINKLVLREDFEVKLKQEIIAPNFLTTANGTQSKIEILKAVETFIKPATDGSMYADGKLMASLGVNNDLQVRVTPVIKGMMNMVNNLKRDLGFDFVYFGGAVKGDPAPYFTNSNVELFVLGEARKQLEPKENYLMLSNQLAREIEKLNPLALDVLEEQSETILRRAFNQDIEALKIFVGLEAEHGNTLEEEEQRLLDEENMTAELFYRNAENFMKSSGFMKRLADFIRKSTQTVENAGRYYTPDASFRHMVSDVYEVVRHMAKGRMAFDSTKSDDMKGIAPGHVVGSRLVNGKFDVDTRKAILGRFPMLHHLEIQVVNNTPSLFLDKDSENNYRGQMMQGRHQGVLYYSLYDMTAEGQSGADYDGDETTDIRFEALTSLVSPSPKYLDYSYLDGELVEGVPWKEDNFTKLKDIVAGGQHTVDMLENIGVVYNEGTFTMANETLQDETVQGIVYETIVKLDGMNNGTNNIGRFTNINSAVLELITLMEEKRDEVIEKGDTTIVSLINAEIQGYKKLNFLIAAAIRWEIDKAKHGGQFYEEMTFLGAFLNAKESGKLGTIKGLEQRYGVKLMRLFKGFANSNDLINKGLDKLGIDRINLVRSDWDKGGLNTSRTISLGKGIDKGADYGTRYSRYIERMNKIANENTRDFYVNEHKNGFQTEAINFMNHMEFNHGVRLNLEDSYSAGMAVMRGEEINNAERLLWSYKNQTSQIQKEINELDNKYRQAYREKVRGDVLNIQKIPTEDLMKKLSIPEEEREIFYELKARRELIMDRHKGLGETMTPEDPMLSALLVAGLYEANVRAQAGLRDDARNNPGKVKQAMDIAKNRLQDKWIETHGNRVPNAEETKAIREWLADEANYEDYLHGDSGLSSIVTLFPLGMVQFFELMGHGEILTDETKGRNAIAFMGLGGDNQLPENVKEVLRDIEGKTITIKDGKWGQLSIDREDLAGRNKSVNVSPKELESLNNSERYDDLSSMVFERGSHLWNGNRTGKVIMTVVYDSGVKIFLEDTHAVK